MKIEIDKQDIEILTEALGHYMNQIENSIEPIFWEGSKEEELYLAAEELYERIARGR